ncbi:MAG TPA: phage portal protein [Atopostipes sp.]|nr:phage portal protein [Atopostipes sp.]
MELTRAAINAKATAISKLKPEFTGGAYSSLAKRLQFKPNPYMDTTKFLYRLATILSVNTTAFIIPLYGKDMKTIVGYYPLLPQNTEVIEVRGEPWLRYTFANGQKAAIELESVGILTNYQFENDFFGDGNEPLMPTLQLMDIQKQGMQEAVKQSANIRFMAKLGQTVRPDDLEREQKMFSKQNLSADNQSGVMMFDAKYSDVKQIESKPFVIDDKQTEQIKQNVFNYFGINEDILQNKFSEDTWNAFYEGSIEPFAIQLGLVMTNMTFTDKEIAHGNQIMWTANRLAYSSNSTKLQMSQQLFDRGILTRNEIREIWQMSPIEDGDKRYIRREYAEDDDISSNKEEVDDSQRNSDESVV